MFRLTREVRFGLNASDAAAGGNSYSGNGYGGVPGVSGFGPFLALRVTLVGELEPKSSYLRNIVDIDREVRKLARPMLVDAWKAGRLPGTVLPSVFATLTNAWPGSVLVALDLILSPFQTLTLRASEPGMIRFSQLFEFSAAHRLHNPALSDAENVQTFGKCNNPLGHGHNYQVQVTLTGTPDANGQLMPLADFERTVLRHGIDPLDHKHLNLQVPAFAEVNPSVENIAKVIYHSLKTPLTRETSRLASVTVWETPKTWCEYSEEGTGDRGQGT